MKLVKSTEFSYFITLHYIIVKKAEDVNYMCPNVLTQTTTNTYHHKQTEHSNANMNPHWFSLMYIYLQF